MVPSKCEHNEVAVEAEVEGGGGGMSPRSPAEAAVLVDELADLGPSSPRVDGPVAPGPSSPVTSGSRTSDSSLQLGSMDWKERPAETPSAQDVTAGPIPVDGCSAALGQHSVPPSPRSVRAQSVMVTDDSSSPPTVPPAPSAPSMLAASPSSPPSSVLPELVFGPPSLPSVILPAGVAGGQAAPPLEQEDRVGARGTDKQPTLVVASEPASSPLLTYLRRRARTSDAACDEPQRQVVPVLTPPAADFVTRVTKRVDSLLARPAIQKRRRKQLPPDFEPRRSSRLKKKGTGAQSASTI